MEKLRLYVVKMLFEDALDKPVWTGLWNPNYVPCEDATCTPIFKWRTAQNTDEDYTFMPG